MSETFLASAILGLSQRPLHPADLARAHKLLPPSASPMAQALALAAAHELKLRVSLPGPQTQIAKTTANIPKQPRAEAGEITNLAEQYFDATGSLLQLPDFEGLWQLGCIAPSTRLLDILERGIQRQALLPLAYAALGPRGAWIGSQHPSFRRKCAVLLNAKPPRGAKQQAAYAAYNLALLRLPRADISTETRLQAETAILGMPQVPAVDASAISALISMLSPLEPHSKQLQIGVLGLFRRLLIEQLPCPDLVWWLDSVSGKQDLPQPTLAVNSSLDVLKFEELSRRAIGTFNESLAASLIVQLVNSGELLSLRHALLPALFSVLGPAAFAKTSHSLLRAYPDALLDDRMAICFRVSPHSFSETTSVELIEQFARLFTYEQDLRAAKWVAKLHPASSNYLQELVHEHPGDKHLHSLLVAHEAFQGMRAAHRK